MKFPVCKFGLRCNPIGAHVTLSYKGRTLLGEVRNARYDEYRGAIFLTVRHFNGEPWPIEPSALSVDVLERREA